MTIDEQSHKQIVRAIFEDGWNRLRFDSFAPFLTETVVFNFRGARQATNVAELEQLIAWWRSAFPDLQFQVEAVIAEGNLAAANLVFTGTHQGEWMGVPATGRPIRVEEMMFFRFEGGKLVEMWEVYDEAEMRRQITA